MHTGQVLNGDPGPNAMAVSPDGRLFVVSHGKVHAFAADGRRVAAVQLEQIGAPRVPSDIAVHSDGRVFLADRVNARLVVCDVFAAKCGGRDLGLPGWTAEQLMPGNTFKFALDERSGRIFISDNGGHRLLIADGTGKVLARTSGSRSIVHFPNQLRSYAPGELTVVDTNNNRVVTYDVSGDRFGAVLRTFSTSAPGIARGGRAWPFAMARLADGSMWVAVAADGMKDADMILYSAGGKPVRRAELGEDSDPWAVASWKDRVLVADARNYRIDAITAEGKVLPQPLDRAFEDELRAAAGNAQAWRDYRTYAIAGIAIFPIAGILILWRLGVPLVAPQRQPIRASAGVAARVLARGETRWVEVDPKFIEAHLRKMRVLNWIMLPLVIAIPAVMVYMFGLETMQRLGIAVLIPALAVLAAVIVNVRFVAREYRKRWGALKLGASTEGLFYTGLAAPTAAKPVSGGPVRWRDVFFDGRRLLAGKSMLLVKLPTGEEVFPREQLESEILARLPRENFVSAGSLGWKALRAAPPMMQLVYAMLALVFVAILVGEMFLR